MEDNEYNEGNTSIKRGRAQVRRKVDFPIFVWVVTILAGAMITISGYLFSELNYLRTEIASESAKSEGLQKELSARIESEREKNQLIREVIVEVKTELKNIREQLERASRK